MSRGWSGRKATELSTACLEFYGDICWICGKAGANTADHIVPRYLGGADSLDNLLPAHQSCNSRRGNAMQHGRYKPWLRNAESSRRW